MHLDQDGKIQPYRTKVERINDLEAAMERIASEGMPLAECVALAVSMRRTDNRWSTESPRGYKAVKEAEDAEGKGGAATGN